MRLNQNRKAGSLGSKRVMLTTLDGDYHDFGISLAAIICAESDHIVHWMGPSLPPTAVVEAVNRTRSDILIMPSPKPRYDVLAQHPRVYLEELCPQLPKLCELWIGGDDASFLTPAILSARCSIFEYFMICKNISCGCPHSPLADSGRGPFTPRRKLRMECRRGQKFIMGTSLHNSTFIHHKNLITAYNRRP